MRHTVVWALALVGVLAILAVEMIPAAVMAAALVAYFTWRANVRRRILADAEDDRRAA